MDRSVAGTVPNGADTGSFNSAHRTIGSLGCEQSMKHFQHHQVNALLLAYTVIQTLRSLLN